MNTTLRKIFGKTPFPCSGNEPSDVVTFEMGRAVLSFATITRYVSNVHHFFHYGSSREKHVELPQQPEWTEQNPEDDSIENLINIYGSSLAT